MSINVHKIIGYGLTDVKTGRSEKRNTRVLLDKRFDRNGIMYSSCEEQEDRWTQEGYKRFLSKWSNSRRWPHNAHLDVFTFDRRTESSREHLYKSLKFWQPASSVIYNEEFGLSNVMVVVPFAFWTKWSRYNNIIDHTEESALHGQVPRVVELSRGVYPYTNRFWSPRNRTTRVFGLRHSTEKPLFEDELIERLANKTLVPEVPSEVRALAEYTRLFTNLDDVYKLKPLLYVYWA